MWMVFWTAWALVTLGIFVITLAQMYKSAEAPEGIGKKIGLALVIALCAVPIWLLTLFLLIVDMVDDLIQKFRGKA
jgi:hypothetical protein